MESTKEEIFRKYKKIADIMPYFSVDEKTGTMRFIGETLEVRIPKRYEVYDLLTIGDTITSLAICDLIFDGKYRAGLMMFCQVEMDNGGLEEGVIDNIPYIAVHLTHGDRFMTNTTVVRNKDISYAVFVEFITKGKLIYFIDYKNILTLFDQTVPMTDTNLHVDHVVFETIYAHLFRDSKNLHLQYRYTDMKNPGTMIGLRSINYATDSTSARLIGANFPIGLNSALIVESTEQHLAEDLLRA